MHDYETDYQGTVRVGDDKLNEIEVMRKECQRKGDINHSLRLEIKEKEKELKLVQEEIK